MQSTYSNHLTPRELEVASIIYLPNKQIAEILGISGTTVSLHMNRIHTKLGTTNKSECVLILQMKGVAINLAYLTAKPSILSP